MRTVTYSQRRVMRNATVITFCAMPYSRKVCREIYWHSRSTEFANKMFHSVLNVPANPQLAVDRHLFGVKIRGPPATACAKECWDRLRLWLTNVETEAVFSLWIFGDNLPTPPLTGSCRTKRLPQTFLRKTCDLANTRPQCCRGRTAQQ